MNPRLESEKCPKSVSNSASLTRCSTNDAECALKQVRQNQGAPGIDGMSVDELPGYLRDHWLEIRAQLIAEMMFVIRLWSKGLSGTR